MAQERSLVAYGTNTSVTVWKDVRSLHEGTEMIRARVHQQNPGLVNSLLACFVPQGTKVVVSDSSEWGVYNVLVTSGDDVGCRGTVERSDFK
jgi:hypothetical protein